MYDKITVLIVLGSLIKKPAFFLDNRYQITEKDFVERFHIIVFSAIKNLYFSGVQTITPIEIDTYLSQFAVQKKIFDDNNGLQYIENLNKFAKVENFDFHYAILKKYTLLRQLKSKGIDVSCFIDESIVDPKRIEEMMKRFASLTVNDILDEVERRIVEVKDNFYNSETDEEQQIGEGLSTLVESFKLSPEIGAPLNSNILNTIFRGARRKKLYLKSSPSGCYKSRMLLGDCAKISIPYHYNTETDKWDYTGFCEPTLFITTELEVDEVQTMLISYVSGVNETNILDGNYAPGQEERVKQAIKYIEESKMYIIHLPNYSSEDIARTIKKYKLLHNVGYVYFDYIFSTPKLLSESARVTNGIRLREDNVLLLLTTRLKDLCNELDVHISTCTQVSDGWQTAKYPDSSLIRSCKALADKADTAVIGLPVSKEDRELIQPLMANGCYPEPNICYHIYKVRRGSYNKIRLYMYFDAGTCRTTELFATNNEGEYVEINGTNIEKILSDTTIHIGEEPEEETPAETEGVFGAPAEIAW